MGLLLLVGSACAPWPMDRGASKSAGLPCDLGEYPALDPGIDGSAVLDAMDLFRWAAAFDPDGLSPLKGGLEEVDAAHGKVTPDPVSQSLASLLGLMHGSPEILGGPTPGTWPGPLHRAFEYRKRFRAAVLRRTTPRGSWVPMAFKTLLEQLNGAAAYVNFSERSMREEQVLEAYRGLGDARQQIGLLVSMDRPPHDRDGVELWRRTRNAAVELFRLEPLVRGIDVVSPEQGLEDHDDLVRETLAQWLEACRVRLTDSAQAPALQTADGAGVAEEGGGQRAPRFVLRLHLGEGTFPLNDSTGNMAGSRNMALYLGELAELFDTENTNFAEALRVAPRLEVVVAHGAHIAAVDEAAHEVARLVRMGVQVTLNPCPISNVAFGAVRNPQDIAMIALWRYLRANYYTEINSGLLRLVPGSDNLGSLAENQSLVRSLFSDGPPQNQGVLIQKTIEILRARESEFQDRRNLVTRFYGFRWQALGAGAP